MITKYYEFINENNEADGITTEEIELLKKYKIKNYRFNEETKMIDVDGDIDFSSKRLKNLPEIRFGKINGYFTCYNNQLTSLEYCPTSVSGYFSCSVNQLTSLLYCPTSVTGGFYCHNNQLTSLLYCPTTVTGGFYCSGNQLTSLEYCPSIVTGNFDCCFNKFTSLEDYPLSLINGTISDIFHFPIILDLVKSKPDVYRPLIESKNKIRFHQQIMRDDPGLIPKYTTISPPSKRTII